MKTKKYLVSTLLASGLIFGLPSVPTASAQLKSLQPQTSWTISKVDKASQAGKSYCTLSRKYDDGVVLSVARNQAEEYSLAIDFQKDSFEKDKALKIQLEPGPGQLRAYDLMPVSTKAVVIRLGWDDGFFDTLGKSQQMKVRIADNAYTFAMPDILKGQEDLGACMKGLQGNDAPATTMASTDVLNAAPVNAGEGFDAKRLDTPEGQTALAAAKMDVRKQEEKVLQDFAANVAAQEKKAEPVKTSSNFNKTEKAAANKPAAMVASSNAAPEPAVPVAASPVAKPASAPVVAAVPAPIPMKQDTALLAEVSRLKAEMAELQKENDSLQQKMASAQKTQQQTLSAQAQANEKQLEDKIAKLEATNDGLVKQLEIASRVTAQKDTAADVARAQVEAQKEGDAKRIAALEAANADLQKKLADASKAAATTVASQAETTQSAQRVAALNAEVADLKERLARQTSMTPGPGEGPNAAQKIAQLDAQVKDLQQKLAAATTAAASQQTGTAQQLKAQEEASSKMLADLRAQNVELQQKLDQASKVSAAAKPDEVKMAALQTEITALKAKNQQLEETVKIAQTQVAEAAFNAEGKSLKQVADLEVRLEAAQRDNVALSKQIDDLKNRQDDARLSLVGGNWDLEQATRRFNEAEREIRRLGLQLEQSRTSCNREKAEIEQMLFDPAVTEDKQREKFVALQAELNEAKEQLADQTKLVQSQVDAQVKQKTAEIAAERDRLQEQVMAMQVQQPRAGQAAGGADVQKLRDENIMLRSEAERLRLQIADASSNGAVRADNIASMRLEVEDLKRQLAMKDNQARTYQNQLATIQRENSQIKTRLSSAGDNIAGRVASLAPAAGSVAPSAIAGRGPSYHSSNDVKEASVSPKAKDGAFGKDDLENLLRQSGMAVNGMKKAPGGLSGAENYGWNNGGKLKGSASVKAASGNFDATVNQYIAAQKAQCSGDFASVPSPADKGGRNITTYETACVSGEQSTSASILFFEEGGKFVAISSQTDATDMDVAMDARDKLAGVVRGM